MNSERIKIVLTDDHSLFAEGLASLLGHEPDMEITHVLNDARTLLSLLKETSPDIILLDINMPGINGLEAIKLILERNRMQKIIMLSTYDDTHLIQQARQSGAMGYLFKNAHPHDLTRVIREIHLGGQYFPDKSNKEARSSDFSADGKREPLLRYLSLTSREQELLKFMVNNSTSEQIAEELHISFHTVKTHRKNIMRKLNVKTPAALVKLVMEHHLLE